MDQELKKLISLQSVDDKIQEIESLSGDLPNRVEKKESQLTSIQDKLESNSEKIDTLEKESRKMSAEIEDHQVKLNKYKDQLFLVKTNKEYDALNHEIDHLKGAVSQSEDSLLTMQEEIESESEMKKVNETDIEELVTSLKTDKKHLDGALSDSKGELEELNNSRGAIAKAISNSFLSKYNQLQTTRGSGVASLNGNCCGGCYSTLPPQMIIEIQSNNVIHTCPSCSVFMFSEEETVEE